MKLYTDSEGNWRGTQAEARRDLHMWTTEEVPTSKADLLTFLNTYKVGEIYADDATAEQAPVKSAVSPIDESNLKLAYEQAGLARESLKRVFYKLDKLNNNFNDTNLEDT
jgi:hypothetical protein|tara:strand:- start:139 stop:468 length:330 start_codon:yes stop_codon:yes gene_type:complete